jgi:hypothetical protein
MCNCALDNQGKKQGIRNNAALTIGEVTPKIFLIQLNYLSLEMGETAHKCAEVN